MKACYSNIQCLNMINRKLVSFQVNKIIRPIVS